VLLIAAALTFLLPRTRGAGVTRHAVE
jgi:hypothetical protein